VIVIVTVTVTVAVTQITLLAWIILSITLLACEMSSVMW